MKNQLPLIAGFRSYFLKKVRKTGFISLVQAYQLLITTDY
jgi:hypothetical protein